VNRQTRVSARVLTFTPVADLMKDALPTEQVLEPVPNRAPERFPPISKMCRTGSGIRRHVVLPFCESGEIQPK